MNPGHAIKLIEGQLEAGETILKWGDAALKPVAVGRKAQLRRGAAAVTDRRLVVLCGDTADPQDLTLQRADISDVHSYWEKTDQHSVVVMNDGVEHIVYGLSTSMRGALAAHFQDADTPTRNASRPTSGSRSGEATARGRGRPNRWNAVGQPDM